MRPAIHTLTHTAATAAAAVILDRVIPAVAVGIAVIAHTLAPEQVRAEIERRCR